MVATNLTFMTGETVYVSGGPRVADREDSK
jgi:hypothetical protein